jgi:hypothetical protein
VTSMVVGSVLHWQGSATAGSIQGRLAQQSEAAQTRAGEGGEWHRGNKSMMVAQVAAEAQPFGELNWAT